MLGISMCAQLKYKIRTTLRARGKVFCCKIPYHGGYCLKKNKKTEDKCSWGCGEKESLVHSGNVIRVTPGENTGVSQKIKIRATVWFPHSISGFFPHSISGFLSWRAGIRLSKWHLHPHILWHVCVSQDVEIT